MRRKGYRSFAQGIDGASIRRWMGHWSLLALLVSLAVLGSGIAEDDVESWDESAPEGAGARDEPPAEPAEDGLGGCPEGQVDIGTPGERMRCRAACPEGQQYNPLADGRMVCGPACGPDASPTSDGSCRCLREGATFDPATGTCGCPPGQVDVGVPGERMRCRPACPDGQRYKLLPDGRMVCRPR